MNVPLAHRKIFVLFLKISVKKQNKTPIPMMHCGQRRVQYFVGKKKTIDDSSVKNTFLFFLEKLS